MMLKQKKNTNFKYKINTENKSVYFSFITTNKIENQEEIVDSIG